jgi:hypothetical protein
LGDQKILIFNGFHQRQSFRNFGIKPGLRQFCTPLAKFLGFELLKVATALLLSALVGFEFPEKDLRAS